MRRAAHQENIHTILQPLVWHDRLQPLRYGVCYNIENVKEQHQGEAKRQSVQR